MFFLTCKEGLKLTAAELHPILNVTCLDVLAFFYPVPSQVTVCIYLTLWLLYRLLTTSTILNIWLKDYRFLTNLLAVRYSLTSKIVWHL